jgi:acyl carrier protein
MVSEDEFFKILASYVKVGQVGPDDVLFGSGLDISSIAFAEFIMDIEEMSGEDIDIDRLDNAIVTAGQLYRHIARIASD